MPPELFKKSGTYNEKVDIWCLGCLLFYMLTEENVFKSEDFKVCLRRIVNDRVSGMPSAYTH